MNIVAACHITSRGLSYAVVCEFKVELPAESHRSVGFCPSLGMRLRVTDAVRNLSQLVSNFLFISESYLVH